MVDTNSAGQAVDSEANSALNATTQPSSIPEPDAGAVHMVMPDKQLDDSNDHTSKDDTTLQISNTELIRQQSARDSRNQYISYIRQLKQVWADQPDVTVDMHNYSYVLPLPASNKIPNLLNGLAKPFTSVIDLVTKRQKDAGIMLLPVLDGITLTIKPATMTLLLGPPGSGKSALLKSLSGQLWNNQRFMSGDIRFNGRSHTETSAYVNKLTAYCNQVDKHFATLTVRETLQFALDNTVAELNGEVSPELSELHRNKVEVVLELLGLTECADTIVGNALMRGISGGQQKRTTLGEMLITNARLLALDEVTNGLDAAVAVDIMRSLAEWCQASGGSVVTSLQQPTPEIVELFDNVVLLRDGRMVYSGPLQQCVPYLQSLGAVKPPVMDDADFIIAYLSNPHRYVSHDTPTMNHNDNTYFNKDTAKLDNIDNQTTDGLVAAWHSTVMYEQQCVDVEKRNGAEQSAEITSDKDHSELTQRTFYRQSTHSFTLHFLYCLRRQGKLVARNKALLIPRIFQSVFVGFIIGGLYFNLGTDSFSSISRMGLILATLISTPWPNLAELPFNDEAKPVIWKQIDAGFYTPTAFTVAQTLLGVPIVATESMVLSLLVYWMGFFAADAGRFFFFFWCVFLSDSFFSALFRYVSYSVPNRFKALTICAPSAIMMGTFAGFLITYPKIPDWLWEFYWINPFAWLARAMGISEFSDPRYDTVVPAQQSSTGQPGRVGDIALNYWQFQTEAFWQWLAFAPLIVYFIGFSLLVVRSISKKRFEIQLGTRRLKATEIAPASGGVQRAITIDRQVSSGSVLPFLSIELVWKHISYTLPTVKKVVGRQLLTDITAYCKPGTCTALMGSSGAGKTTLMDVIAGRKTGGKIEGQILLNGQPKVDEVFQRITGYVEQTDLHMPLSTVKEALMFSANLRLPASVPYKKRESFVNELLVLLELDQLQNRLIGNGDVSGLSPAQCKLVTIGVELAANPSILFLDEPTSGIDSRAALVVMRVVRRIAATGRTVLCTIHQPSSELFFMFDRLVLLKTGGTTVYNGPIGNEGKDIVNYFESAAGPQSEKRLNELQNPASWMLEVLMRAKDVNYTDVWNKHEMQAETHRDVDTMVNNWGNDNTLEQRDTSRQNKVKEIYYVLHREFITYYRNTSYTLSRCFLNVGLGIVFGLLYLNLASDVRNGGLNQLPAGINSIIGGLMISIGFVSVASCATATPVVASERPIYYRERVSKTYGSISYSISLWLVELPFLALSILLFCLPYYYLTGFLNDGVEFLKFYCVVYLCANCLNSMGHWLSSFTPNLIIATQLQGLLFSIIFQFAGVYIRKAGPNGIKTGWIWVYYMNPLPKTINAIAMAQYGCVGSGCPSIQNGGTITISDYLADDYLDASVGGTYYAEQVGWLILTWFVFRIMTVLALKYISYLKR